MMGKKKLITKAQKVKREKRDGGGRSVEDLTRFLKIVQNIVLFSDKSDDTLVLTLITTCKAFT